MLRAQVVRLDVAQVGRFRDVWHPCSSMPDFRKHKRCEMTHGSWSVVSSVSAIEGGRIRAVPYGHDAPESDGMYHYPHNFRTWHAVLINDY